MYEYLSKIVSVYDGDTVRADIDLGFGVWLQNQKIRLFGIDAPEMRGSDREKAKGKESRDWLRDQLKGQAVTIQTIRDRKGKYGRWLGRLIVKGVDLNQKMVEEGLAVDYMADS